MQLTDALPNDVCDHLTELVYYVWAMWIESQMWLPCVWSAYWSSVHTNNNVIIIAVVYSLHTPFQHIFGGHKKTLSKGRNGRCTLSSANAAKPTRRAWRAVKVTKYGIIQYVRYDFLLLCCTNFVLNMRHFRDKRRFQSMGIKN